MAAVTVNTIKQESVGSMKLIIASVTAGATSLDTWASGIPGIVGCWTNTTSASNTATNANGVTVSVSGSTLTFRAETSNETMTNFDVFVLAKS